MNGTGEQSVGIDWDAMRREAAIGSVPLLGKWSVAASIHRTRSGMYVELRLWRTVPRKGAPPGHAPAQQHIMLPVAKVEEIAALMTAAATRARTVWADYSLPEATDDAGAGTSTALRLQAE